MSLGFGSIIIVLLLSDVPVTAARPAPLFRWDPVRLQRDDATVAGDANLSLERDGFRYCFESESTRRVFLNAPERYAAQLDGACTRLGPLARYGDPELFTVHDGHLYFFGSPFCKQAFTNDPGAYLPRNDEPLSGSPEAFENGRRWIERAARAIANGSADLSALRGWTRVESYPVRIGEEAGIFERRLTTAGCYYITSARSIGDIAVSVLSPTGAWVQTTYARPLHAAGRQVLTEQWARQPLVILQALERPDFQALVVESADAEAVVRVRFAGVVQDVLIHPHSGRITGLRYRGRGPDYYFGEIVERFSAFKSVDGVLVPYRVQAFFNGEPWKARSHEWNRVELRWKNQSQ